LKHGHGLSGEDSARSVNAVRPRVDQVLTTPKTRRAAFAALAITI